MALPKTKARRLAWEMQVSKDSRPLPQYVYDECSYYERAARQSWRGFAISESLALASAALVPVVLTIGLPRTVGAVLGALAAVASGARSIFRWKDNFAARSITLEQIRSAIAKYNTSPDPDPSRLVREVSKYVMEETRQWREGFLSVAPPAAGATGPERSGA